MNSENFAFMQLDRDPENTCVDQHVGNDTVEGIRQKLSESRRIQGTACHLRRQQMQRDFDGLCALTMGMFADIVVDGALNCVRTSSAASIYRKSRLEASSLGANASSTYNAIKAREEAAMKQSRSSIEESRREREDQKTLRIREWKETAKDAFESYMASSQSTEAFGAKLACQDVLKRVLKAVDLAITGGVDPKDSEFLSKLSNVFFGETKLTPVGRPGEGHGFPDVRLCDILDLSDETRTLFDSAKRASDDSLDASRFVFVALPDALSAPLQKALKSDPGLLNLRIFQVDSEACSDIGAFLKNVSATIVNGVASNQKGLDIICGYPMNLDQARDLERVFQLKSKSTTGILVYSTRVDSYLSELVSSDELSVQDELPASIGLDFAFYVTNLKSMIRSMSSSDQIKTLACGSLKELASKLSDLYRGAASELSAGPSRAISPVSSLDAAIQKVAIMKASLVVGRSELLRAETSLRVSMASSLVELRDFWMAQVTAARSQWTDQLKKMRTQWRKRILTSASLMSLGDALDGTSVGQRGAAAKSRFRSDLETAYEKAKASLIAQVADKLTASLESIEKYVTTEVKAQLGKSLKDIGANYEKLVRQDSEVSEAFSEGISSPQVISNDQKEALVQAVSLQVENEISKSIKDSGFSHSLDLQDQARRNPEATVEVVLDRPFAELLLEMKSEVTGYQTESSKELDELISELKILVDREQRKSVSGPN